MELDDGIEFSLKPYQSTAFYEHNDVEQFVDDLVLSLKDVEEFNDCLAVTDSFQCDIDAPPSVPDASVTWDLDPDRILTIERVQAPAGELNLLFRVRPREPDASVIHTTL